MLTITEALQEIKTIDKRVMKKLEWIEQLVARNERVRDPVEKEGGSAQVIERERQSIADLHQRKVQLRLAINRANDETGLTVNGVARSISEWIVWRREVAPSQQEILRRVRGIINQIRTDLRGQGRNIVTSQEAAEPNDAVVNVSESELAKETEELEDTLGQLDGKLSLLNATTAVTVED